LRQGHNAQQAFAKSKGLRLRELIPALWKLRDLNALHHRAHKDYTVVIFLSETLRSLRLRGKKTIDEMHVIIPSSVSKSFFDASLALK
jgi:hypothetical protein